MLGLRDIILLLVALAAIYLVVMLIRLTLAGRRRHGREELAGVATEKIETVSPLRQRAGAEPVIAPAAVASAYEDEGDGEEVPAEPFAVSPAPTFEWDDVRELFGEETPVPPPAAPPPVRTEPPRQGGFGEALSAHLARSDMETEIQRMRDEMERMRIEMEEMRTSRRVSPQYAEAMELSQRGMSAQDVADRLGISLAEAELVHALSRGQRNFDEGEKHGADGNVAGFDGFGRHRG